VYVIPARGGFPRRLTNGKLPAFGPSWSGDGQWIYYCSANGGLWKIPRGGGSPVPAVKSAGFLPMESRDGKFLYCTRQTGIWKVPLGGGKETRIVPGVSTGGYALTEKGIYFAAPPASRFPTLQFYDFATGKTRLVANIDSPDWAGVAAAPDGRTVLFTKFDRYGTDLMLVENFR